MGAFVIPRGLLIVPVLVLLFASYSSATEVVTIDVYKAKALLQLGYTYIDVRTEGEYNNGHVDAKKILNIPYMFNTSEGRVKNPDFVKEVLSACGKYARLVVGCQTGARSINATKDLVNAGFKHVFNMDGGYAAWVEKGFPVKKPSGTEVVSIDIYKAKALLHSGYGYLDTRTDDEFKNGIVDVKNILNIPYLLNTPEGLVKNPDFVKQVLSTYGKYAHFVVGCEIGLRSINATTDLVNAGFKHVFDMTGGYSAWVENGFPMKRPSGKEVVTIETYKAKNFLNGFYGYVDVRTEEEFKKGHVDVESIINIPYMFNTSEGMVKNRNFVKQVLSARGKYALLVVGCQTGSRSINASTDLVKAGFKHVLNMDGGYAAWVKNGFPVKKTSGTPVVTIDIYRAKALLHSGYGYLDIRTEDELKNGHVDVKNILNIPYLLNTPEGFVKNPDFVKQVLSAYDKYAHFVVGCEIGVRSLNATTDLVNAGFKHVFDMAGGYAAWVENGFPAKRPSGKEVVTIETYKAKNFLHAIYGYLDVRTEEEFKKGHVDVKNITNIPYRFNTTAGMVKNPEFVKQVLSAWGKFAHIVVGCQTGSRSINASSELVHAGFKHVFNMDGGYAAWVEDGFPVKKP
ncbi:uncharacterized protein LOC132266581 [Cornus florida]|uniref:uncharacterized protein LOC132266581 n=1 Tax=Cornus florida TaxID=4283 RepID=UPI0028A2AEDC|nr:uncharacterized protein LOC132266581 [Cornus florida]